MRKSFMPLMLMSALFFSCSNKDNDKKALEVSMNKEIKTIDSILDNMQKEEGMENYNKNNYELTRHKAILDSLKKEYDSYK